MSKMAVVINSNDPETAWNAMRFALTSLVEGHDVTVFLMGAGVEIEGISHPKFNPSQVIKDFIENNGKFMICGACLDVRKKGTDLCPKNVMSDLVNLVEASDKVVTFG